ncbi:MAG: BON domain-containing protein [Burkholderiales bacterium]|nr:BON domain-containing protein [Burkholderiales bacterium]
MKKSDSQLQHDVLEELKWEPSVHATEIGVEVKDGVVTLSGEVHNFAEKWHAERAAQRVCGVNALAIDMKLKAPGLGGRTDADIARSAEQVLEWSTSVPEGTIKVMVENGFITLRGSVGWQYQRLAAAASVRFLMGVTGVSNLITIKPHISMSAVKDDIEVALKRTASADAKKIHVSVNGSDITLTGKVQSWAERETAVASAWRTPGVLHVHDKMSLEF